MTTNSDEDKPKKVLLWIGVLSILGPTFTALGQILIGVSSGFNTANIALIVLSTLLVLTAGLLMLRYARAAKKNQKAMYQPLKPILQSRGSRRMAPLGAVLATLPQFMAT
ncbi:hypothetical protein RCH23_003163 [Cryobacterium sp. CAN_C3]|uniref:hypothetical protein n=1 Tax=unclassified Cryobacterium TaxID=2649013 RepID=UPI0018CB15E3|nr:hypothetical protein [Cryobacterium sp. CAN_C3]MEC5155762.1 hypothetical protein [Cryobacterium sp. CAN_C3]